MTCRDVKDQAAGIVGSLWATRGGGLTGVRCAGRECLKAFCMQLAVLSNHQNGRDTHIRQVHILQIQKPK